MGGAPPRNYAGHDVSCPYEDIGDEEPGLKPNSFFAQCFAGLPFGRLRVKSPAVPHRRESPSRSREDCWASFFVDDAGFHNEDDFLECADVLQRIAANGDDVGEVPRLESPDLAIPREQLCAVQ